MRQICTGWTGWLTWRRAAALALGTVTLALVAQGGPVAAQRQEARGATRPNVVLVLTDDQRADDLDLMPVVMNQLAARGTRFSNAFVTNAWCCPARAGILSGTWSHTNHVYWLDYQYGPATVFDESKTMATWLHGAGYRTALIGKYFNDYVGPRIPPGWDDFQAFSDLKYYLHQGYYNYTLNENGTLKTYGSAPADYSTDVFASKAVDFVRSTPAGRPLFLYFSTMAPHGYPVSRAKDETKLKDRVYREPPSFGKVEPTKPGWLKKAPAVAKTAAQYQQQRQVSARPLLAVDDAVSRLLAVLQSTNRLSNTLFVFMSDNGIEMGEHNLNSVKEVAYEESIRVPMVIRYDPVTKGLRRVSTRMALNTDIAPTVAKVTGVPAPGAEGRSLLPLLANPTGPFRTDFLIEHSMGSPPPAGEPTATDWIPNLCAVRTTSQKLIWYPGTGEVELYDLATDPYELRNLAGTAGAAALQARLKARVMTLCQPRPPVYVPLPGAPPRRPVPEALAPAAP